MTPAPKYPCARCGKRAPADQMVYSRWSKNRYCSNLDECKQRSKRRKVGQT